MRGEERGVAQGWVAVGRGWLTHAASRALSRRRPWSMTAGEKGVCELRCGEDYALLARRIDCQRSAARLSLARATPHHTTPHHTTRPSCIWQTHTHTHTHTHTNTHTPHTHTQIAARFAAFPLQARTCGRARPEPGDDVGECHAVDAARDGQQQTSRRALQRVSHRSLHRIARAEPATHRPSLSLTAAAASAVITHTRTHTHRAVCQRERGRGQRPTESRDRSLPHAREQRPARAPRRRTAGTQRSKSACPVCRRWAGGANPSLGLGLPRGLHPGPCGLRISG